MIIKALNDCYQRLANDPSSGVSPPNYMKKPVAFGLVISEKGQLLHIIDLRVTNRGKLIGRMMDVPKEQTRSRDNTRPYFLCDNCDFVLGLCSKGTADLASEKRAAFSKYHQEILENVDDAGSRALLAFLEIPNTQGYAVVQAKKDDLLRSGNLVFLLEGETRCLHERPAVRAAWELHSNRDSSSVIGQCLVTGEEGPLAQLHPDIKGVYGADKSGAPLVSFNKAAFVSYGKEQSYNAPVSETAAFAYSTALNHLLADKRHRIQIGDATTVLWAERAGLEEDLLMELLDPAWDSMQEEDPSDTERVVNDPSTSSLVREVLSRVRDQRHISPEMLQGLDTGVRFFILGLSPNVGRISVRFWIVNSFGDLVEKISRHYAHMAIGKRYPSDPNCIPLWQILKATAPQGDLKNVSPLLAGAIARSILLGQPYPQALYTAILARFRAGDDIDYVRAAVVKACLIRNSHRAGEIDDKVVKSMGLDEKSTNTAYRLGRLFALMEKAQRDASSSITSTIRDRYFGAASATPRMVFPQLLRLSQHHIVKSEYGGITDRRIQEVVDGLDKFPAQLNLEEQGLFVLGYYHQRNALYQKSEKKEGEHND